MHNYVLTGVEHSIYGYDKNSSKLFKGKNIGTLGENLSIVIISFNRSQYTCTLLESIQDHLPNFAGELIVFDNASEPEHLQAVKKKLDEIKLRYKLIESAENLGASRGRNTAFREVGTDWLLSIDNDMYFLDNPLKDIHDTIASSGSLFINLASLDANGEDYLMQAGNLWINPQPDGSFSCNCGPMTQSKRGMDNSRHIFALSTFLASTAEILHKETFFSLGGFDEAYFVGLEDTDFSILLYNRGYKVANIMYPYLAHNHPKPTRNKKTDYDSIRYRYDIQKANADHFFSKHGLIAWDKSMEDFMLDISSVYDDTSTTYEEEPSFEDVLSQYQRAQTTYKDTFLKDVASDNEMTLMQQLRDANLMITNLEAYAKKMESLREELIAYSTHLEMYTKEANERIGTLCQQVDLLSYQVNEKNTQLDHLENLTQNERSFIQWKRRLRSKFKK